MINNFKKLKRYIRKLIDSHEFNYANYFPQFVVETVAI